MFDAAGGTAVFGDVAGSGFVSNGTLSVIGTLSPGDAEGAVGTLSVSNLTLNAGSALRYDWTKTTNDLFAVRGLLTAQPGGTIDFGHEEGDELQIPFSAVLGTYSGSFSGSFGSWKATNIGLPTRVAVATTVSAKDGVVRISIKYSGLVILLR